MILLSPNLNALRNSILLRASFWHVHTQLSIEALDPINNARDLEAIAIISCIHSRIKLPVCINLALRSCHSGPIQLTVCVLILVSLHILILLNEPRPDNINVALDVILSVRCFLNQLVAAILLQSVMKCNRAYCNFFLFVRFTMQYQTFLLTH